jgi:hypothetical protein
MTTRPRLPKVTVTHREMRQCLLYCIRTERNCDDNRTAHNIACLKLALKLLPKGERPQRRKGRKAK